MGAIHLRPSKNGNTFRSAELTKKYVKERILRGNERGNLLRGCHSTLRLCYGVWGYNVNTFQYFKAKLKTNSILFTVVPCYLLFE